MSEIEFVHPTYKESAHIFEITFFHGITRLDKMVFPVNKISRIVRMRYQNDFECGTIANLTITHGSDIIFIIIITNNSPVG